VRDLITVAPITTRIRNIPVEVPLGATQGLNKNCVANLDTITTVPKRCLSEMVASLSAAKIAEIDEAIQFALGLK
jgi:mRNA interferase MazF